ncbi:S41 family peptidase [Marinigracilibium pacificum]|uniref:Tricorn protease homolog n=1 Tax=Marinigracilibium pacificum TaxID=2729599 RepID=A0A848J202_9BACT|nr:S41 family peptidase [Marinigracilibium pacificum]NMM48570.1 peptidase S41 [Marinigracilibium pacificum]
MKKTNLFIPLILGILLTIPVRAQLDARLFYFPDVSATHITFAYANDIWIVSKDGGTANRLTSASGQEILPKFSPDGTSVAFSGNYEGSSDVYVISAQGGVPKRLTYHGSGDRIIDWHPDGEKILFASSRESGRQRFSQFFLISKDGGFAEKLSVPYGEMASFSPDGSKLAYTDKSRLYRTWKRYRGGMAPDITVFDLKDNSHRLIATSDANEELPMWAGEKIYFLSDRGPEKRYNLWVYDLNNESITQLTNFSEFDVHMPSIGPEEIVFEADGKLHLYSLSNGNIKTVGINIISDQSNLMVKTEKVHKNLQSASISYDGKRAIVEARGDLFSVPAEDGPVINLTNTSGVAERYPSWSPNGKYIASWSDKNGEYNLQLIDLENGEKKILTDYENGFRYQIFWSPDSRKVAFIDQAMRIRVYSLETNKTSEVDKGLWMYHGGLAEFSVSWSPDSRWLAYSRGEMNRNSSIFIYDHQAGITKKITSQFYNDYSPSFDPDGKYLYFLTNREMNPEYGDFDWSFIYTNSAKIAVLPLSAETTIPFQVESDEVEIVKEEPEEDEDDKGKKKKDKKEEDKKEDKSVFIDFENAEYRIVLLPLKSGNYGELHTLKEKLIYADRLNGQDASNLMIYDPKEEESKTIIEGVDGFALSSNGEKLLVAKGGALAVIKAEPDQKEFNNMPLESMESRINPKEEWKQIFVDAWRLERDYFYDKDMHGVDWNAVKEYYGSLVEQANTRDDLNFIIGEMIGELNASHTYRGGGDIEDSKRASVGYLGVDWEIVNGAYRISKVIKGAPWDAEVISPVSMPGTKIKEGDYILAVNGVPLSTDKEPYHAFYDLDNKVVQLTVNDKPSLSGARKELVKTIDRNQDARLRHLAWINTNRKMVEEKSGGRIGYIYVRSTGLDGQAELVRQFAGQWNLEGLIIDERFNSGGQIPDRFIELLNRKPFAYWDVRDGQNWQWPPIGHFGPKAMLINGWSGSGGDAFPDYFRKAGLGPLIGSRTWGGLIGITGAPPLIDGGTVTVPTFRMYNPDGTWFKEGHGVDPDIEVPEDPTKLAVGEDVQLQRAIEYILEELNNKTVSLPAHEANETR